MHKLLSLALPAMLALSLAPQLARAQPAELSAQEVLAKARATYAGFTTYKGTCVMASDYTTTDGKAGGAKAGGVNAGTIQNVAGARASIEFARGQRLDVTGVDTGGHPFHALSTPAQSWIEVFPQADAGQPQAAGARDFILANGDLSAAQLMIAGLTGMTGGVGELIPDALVGNPWNMPFPRLTDAALRPDEKVGEANCYVVVAENARLGITKTYWIEKATFLLRRMEEERFETADNDDPEIQLHELHSTKFFMFSTTEAK